MGMMGRTSLRDGHKVSVASRGPGVVASAGSSAFKAPPVPVSIHTFPPRRVTRAFVFGIPTNVAEHG